MSKNVNQVDIGDRNVGPGWRLGLALRLIRPTGRVEETQLCCRLSLACIRRFQLRARLGLPWRIRGLPPHRPRRADFPQRVRQADSLPELQGKVPVESRQIVGRVTGT